MSRDSVIKVLNSFYPSNSLAEPILSYAGGGITLSIQAFATNLYLVMLNLIQHLSHLVKLSLIDSASSAE